ncbi:MAG: hypothetical protein AWU54_441 [Candidatus Frackibacter sp. T328-2]|nr:MAG: hypothetical protein AWU54_441 [Candidatus Frackibacter sp. T328-2]
MKEQMKAEKWLEQIRYDKREKKQEFLNELGVVNEFVSADLNNDAVLDIKFGVNVLLKKINQIEELKRLEKKVENYLGDLK